MNSHDDPEIVNVGTGEDLAIRELAEKIAAAANFHGRIAWDSSQPNGMLRKCLDISRMRSLGFSPQMSLDRSIQEFVRAFREMPK
jgi:GDP-L-fucose synthase